MPRLALVGDGHDGVHDYLDGDLWWTVESQTDYGAPIEAACLGDIGDNFSMTGASVNGASFYTKDVTYDGSNDSELAFASRLWVDAEISWHDMKFKSTSNYYVGLKLSNLGSAVGSRWMIENVGDGLGGMLSLSSGCEQAVIENFILIGVPRTTNWNPKYNARITARNFISCFGLSGIDGTYAAYPNVSNAHLFGNVTDAETPIGISSNIATEDSTSPDGKTGYGGGELVNVANRDFRTKKDSDLADDGSGGFIGAFLEKSSTPNESYNFSASINQQIKFSGTTNKTGNANALITQNYQANSLTTKTINYEINQKQVVSLNSNTIKSANLNSVIAQNYKNQATANKQTNANGSIIQSILLTGYFNNSQIETHQFNATITINPTISAAVKKQNVINGQVEQQATIAAAVTKVAIVKSNCFYQVTFNGYSTKQNNISGLLNQSVALSALFINTATPIHLRQFRINGQIVFQRFNGAIVTQRFNGVLN